MYSISDFEPYTLRKHLGEEPILAWSKKNGYHILTFLQRHTDDQDYKIIGVMK